ncbi:MAG: hypothetical protein K2P79_01310 [Sphingomonas sp.]|nr:hypothetical protein [Sphingomonas sp.]
MAKGNEIGEFSHNSLSVTLLPGPAGATLHQANVEGTATGYGFVRGTATFVGSGKGGSYSALWAGFLEDGEVLSGTSAGSYESAGLHVWNTKEIVHVSDGTILHSEGVIDNAARTWKGKLYASV